jgi:hypothetical protein
MTPQLERLLSRVPVRLFVAAVLIVYQLVSVAGFARQRYGYRVNADPGSAPRYDDLSTKGNGQLLFAGRLIFARWDAGQYILLTLLGDRYCPARHKLEQRDLQTLPKACKLAFYPGYPLIARAVVKVTKLPADYALLAVSLAASFLFLFLWTDPAVTRALGTVETYIALIAFNAFPTSCYLVFLMTEPCVLLFTLAAFVALLRKQYLVGALLAGAASGMRIGGAATSLAFALAVVVETWNERSRGWALFRRIACVPLSAWGAFALMGYHAWRFGDPLVYVHAHAVAYQVTGGLRSVLLPRVNWIMHSLDGPTHDLMWGIAIVLWFLLGHRETLGRFRPAAQVFCYAIVVLTLGIAYAGSIELNMRGFARYALVAFPIFYAIATFLRTRPVVLVVWLSVCVWHYREVDVCYYLGDVGTVGLQQCNMTQWSTW